jgi:hypothetical protein
MTSNRIAHRRAATIALPLLLGFAWMSGASAAPHAPSGSLVAFHSNAELREFLKHRQRHAHAMADEAMPPPPPPAPPAQAGATETVVTAARASAPGITNNQEAGVDEGDIVKASGDLLVVLHRGRLFTISTAGLRPIDSIDAYPPGVNASGDWYDEMLISGRRIIVIGYSYSRGGTQINRFDLARDGHLAFVDAYQLRSNDYYSSRNYASRLIGHQLIFYTPMYLSPWGEDPLNALPALRRWSGVGPEPGFKTIGSAQQVYIPAVLRDKPDTEISALHTVTTCDVATPVLDCSAMSVLGPDSRTFYVSGNAVYVWLSDWWAERPQASLLYRLPLDGGRPSAVGVRGAPADQFSFREDPADGVLNVLVRSQGGGDAMWRPEFSNGAVALLRVPMEDFGGGSREVARADYRPLPMPDNGDFHDRFVGDYILYGSGPFQWTAPQNRQDKLVVAALRDGRISEIPLAHSIDRIEVMGNDAVIIGSGSSQVFFSAIKLPARSSPFVSDTYARPGAQSETRSHGFFFNPEADGETGVLGLPVTLPARPAIRQLTENSSAITFLRRTERGFLPLGELAARQDSVIEDSCHASCVDWYGNARPIFYRGRIFALMGYELVEGALSREAIAEKGRVSFAPAPPAQRVER